MKPIAMLVVLLGTLLAGMGIILNAPPFVEPAVRFIIGAGLLGTMAVVLGGPIGKALASQLKGEQPGAPADGRVLAQLDDLSQDLQALRVAEPELFRLISEIRLVSRSESIREIIVYPVAYGVRLRLGPRLQAAPLRSAVVILDLLDRQGLGGRLQELDLRTGEVVYTLKED